MRIAALIASADWKGHSDYTVAVIFGNHNGNIIRIDACRRLGMFIAVIPLATVSTRPNEVHRARLQTLQSYFSTTINGNIAKESRRIAVETI